MPTKKNLRRKRRKSKVSSVLKKNKQEEWGKPEVCWRQPQVFMLGICILQEQIIIGSPNDHQRRSSSHAVGSVKRFSLKTQCDDNLISKYIIVLSVFLLFQASSFFSWCVQYFGTCAKQMLLILIFALLSIFFGWVYTLPLNRSCQVIHVWVFKWFKMHEDLSEDDVFLYNEKDILYSNRRPWFRLNKNVFVVGNSNEGLSLC